jgi:hypothetical protein
MTGRHTSEVRHVRFRYAVRVATPTLVVASQGVRRGYTDPARYTHYSVLATVEAALGLGTLTANDRYAPPVNSIFEKPQTNHPERTRGSALPAPLPPPGSPQQAPSPPPRSARST